MTQPDYPEYEGERGRGTSVIAQETEYTREFHIHAQCSNCRKPITFTYEPTFVNTDNMVVIVWACNHCGSGGAIHVINDNV